VSPNFGRISGGRGIALRRAAGRTSPPAQPHAQPRPGRIGRRERLEGQKEPGRAAGTGITSRTVFDRRGTNTQTTKVIHTVGIERIAATTFPVCRRPAIGIDGIRTTDQRSRTRPSAGADQTSRRSARTLPE
jgi:hypothetical protein